MQMEKNINNVRLRAASIVRAAFCLFLFQFFIVLLKATLRTPFHTLYAWIVSFDLSANVPGEGFFHSERKEVWRMAFYFISF